MDHDLLPKTLETAHAPKAAPVGPPPIETADGRWTANRLGAGLVRLLAREGVTSARVFRLWDVDNTSAMAGGSLCVSRESFLAGMQAVLNDNRESSPRHFEPLASFTDRMSGRHDVRGCCVAQSYG